MRSTIGIIILSFIVVMLLSFILTLGGCTSTKQVNKSTEQVDSSYIKSVEKRLEESGKTIQQYEQQIKELQYATVNFNSDCDTVINNIIEQVTNSGCPQARIDSFVAILSKLKSRVKVLSDGSIEAEGNLKNVSVSKEKLQQVTSLLMQEKTKLLLENENLQAEIKRLTEVKSKTSKKKFLNQWWLFPAGMLAGIALVKRKQVLSFLRG